MTVFSLSSMVLQIERVSKTPNVIHSGVIATYPAVCASSRRKIVFDMVLDVTEDSIEV